MGNAIFDALSHYGAYVVDQTGGGGTATLYAEPSTDPAAVSGALQDVSVLLPLVRRVTNNTPASVGGPGLRIAPAAP